MESNDAFKIENKFNTVNLCLLKFVWELKSHVINHNVISFKTFTFMLTVDRKDPS